MGRFTYEEVNRALGHHFEKHILDNNVPDLVFHELAHWFTFESGEPPEYFHDLGYYVDQHLTELDCMDGEEHWQYGRELVAVAAQERFMEMDDGYIHSAVARACKKPKWLLERDLERIRDRNSVTVVVERMEAWVASVLEFLKEAKEMGYESVDSVSKNNGDAGAGTVTASP